jgi:hypothetical protein
MRISGKANRFFLPMDSEVSFNYLRHLYQIGEINNNRIIVNKMVSQKPDAKKKTDVIKTCKAVHFYKYGNVTIALTFFRVESEISLQQGRTFFVNSRGQIFEINLNLVNSKKKDDNLQFYIKNVETFMNVDRAERNRYRNQSPLLNNNGHNIIGRFQRRKTIDHQDNGLRFTMNERNPQRSGTLKDIKRKLTMQTPQPVIEAMKKITTPNRQQNLGQDNPYGSLSDPKYNLMGNSDF